MHWGYTCIQWNIYILTNISKNEHYQWSGHSAKYWSWCVNYSELPLYNQWIQFHICIYVSLLYIICATCIQVVISTCIYPQYCWFILRELPRELVELCGGGSLKGRGHCGDTMRSSRWVEEGEHSEGAGDKGREEWKEMKVNWAKRGRTME